MLVRTLPRFDLLEHVGEQNGEIPDLDIVAFKLDFVATNRYPRIEAFFDDAERPSAGPVTSAMSTLDGD